MDDLFTEIEKIEDAQNIIDECLRESEVLEYKTASVKFDDAAKSEIAKDISSMANSLGGTIIYGVETDKNDKTRPIALQKIEVKNIETLDRVINSQIRPPIKGLNKKLIPKDKPEIMLLSVPQSGETPHQNLYDKKYYRRSGSESVPMEHDLIAMHFGRRTGPILTLLFKAIERPLFPTPTNLMSEEALIRVLVNNSGKKIARDMRLLLSFPSKDEVRVSPKQSDLFEISDVNSHRNSQVWQYDLKESILYPDTTTSIIEIGLSIHSSYLDEKRDKPLFNWTIDTEESQRREGELIIEQLGW